MLAVEYVQMFFAKLLKVYQCSKRLRPSEIMYKRSLPHKRKSNYLFPSLSHMAKPHKVKHTVILSSSLYGKLSTHDSFNSVNSAMLFPIRNFLPEQLGHKDETKTFCFKLVTQNTWTIRLLNTVMTETMPHIVYTPQYCALNIASNK